MLESAKLEVLDITYSNFETKAYFAGNLETNGEHSEDLELDTKIWAQIMGLKKSAEDLEALNKRTVVEKTLHLKCDGTAKTCENVKEVTTLRKDNKALNDRVAHLETQVTQHIKTTGALQVGRE
jgi:hypothetical protein